MKRLLALDSSYTWEDFALDSLEQSTTTRRDVGYLVGKTELVDTSYRVTTTNEREGTFSSSFSYSIADSTAAIAEVIALEYTSRTVPEDGLGTLEGLDELLAAILACVKSLVTGRNSVGRNILHVSTWLEAHCAEVKAIGSNRVSAKHELYTILLGELLNAEGNVKLVEFYD